ncbi:MAG: MFS transporter [Spirochaetes bacterium]|nr:MFS transporter [Spirochaetota bacterium]
MRANAPSEEAQNAGGTDMVPLAMKLGYGTGDLGANLIIQTANIYLLFFFTDVFGIPPAQAGIILLSSKVWDAVSDPLMGMISDHTTSRWGRKRPYLLLGALPMGLSMFLLFSAPPMAAPYRFIFGLFSYMLFCTAITVVDIPYLSLTASLTVDFNERSRLTGIRAGFALAGTLTAAGATLPLVGLLGGGEQGYGFRGTGLLFGLAAALTTLVAFASVRERVASPKMQKPSLRDTVRVIASNPPFLFLTGAMFMFMIGMNVMALVVNYYFKYCLGAESSIPLAFICIFVTAGCALPVFVWLSGRIGKKGAYMTGMGMVILILGITLLMKDAGLKGTLVLFVFAGIGLSTNWLSPWAMIPDTVEFSELKTGLRREATLYGAYYFVFKVGTAMAGFIVGTALTLIGYVPNAQQSVATLGGIRGILTVVPMAFLALGMVLLSFYSIDASAHRLMVQSIERGEKGMNP